MNQDHQLLKYLNSLHSKPEMFWGESEYPFTSLITFLAGMKLTGTKEDDESFSAERLLPMAFHEYVAKHLKPGCLVGGQGWQSLIRETTATEQEAFDLFFELRRDFENVAK